MEVVPAPAVIIALAGTVQLYDDAPAMAAIEYTTLFKGVQTDARPVIVPVLAGADEHPQPIGCQVVPMNDSRQLVVILKMVRPCTAAVFVTFILLRCVVVIRGGKMPCVVEAMSNTADGLGLGLLIPTLPELLFEILFPFVVHALLSVVPAQLRPVPALKALLPVLLFAISTQLKSAVRYKKLAIPPAGITSEELFPVVKVA